MIQPMDGYFAGNVSWATDRALAAAGKPAYAADW
jgi:hypothetical protein